MRKTMIGIGAFLGGLVLGYVFWLLALVIGGEALGVSQFEGSFAMGVAFFVAPMLAIATGAVVMVWALRLVDRRGQARQPD
jgi:hypothetical protein